MRCGETEDRDKQKERLMNKRAVWVIELSPEKGVWVIWPDRPAHMTRREARKRRDGFNHKESVRVVKYVPADEVGRTNKKEGAK